MSSNTKQCKHCKSEIDAKAKVCPVCRKKQGIGCLVPLLIIVGAIILIIAISVALSGESSNSSNSTSSTSNSASTTSEAQTSSEQSNTKADSSVPSEYKSALNKAKTYSDIMHMSKQGIYDQLTSEYGEKFSAEAAQYAIDNLNADYNKNALEKAKDYQEMDMSPEAIRDQLTSEYGEQFTQAEADYAVSNLD